MLGQRPQRPLKRADRGSPLDTVEPPMNDDRRDELMEEIRQLDRALLQIERAAALSFPLDERTQISIGVVQEKPKILFDNSKNCVVVDGKECHSADELWEVAWAAERKQN
jgi:hypothetical protein